MQNYNFIQKSLHDLLFSQKFVNKSLFELEKIIYLKKKIFLTNLKFLLLVYQDLERLVF